MPNINMKHMKRFTLKNKNKFFSDQMNKSPANA
jgi:hypothetical protein